MVVVLSGSCHMVVSLPLFFHLLLGGLALEPGGLS